MPPYLAFLLALGPYLRAAPAELLSGQLATLGPILATIFPELAARLNSEPSYPLPPEQARLRLWEAIGELLAAMAGRQPVLLALDDLQWADGATLDLLCFIARQQMSARLLILGAFRPGEAEQNPALSRAVAELTRLRVLERITLQPLGRAEVDALAAAYLGAPIDEALGRALSSHSEGNAFFVEELLRGWLETDALAQVQGRWRLLAPTGLVSLPAGINGAVARRLELLDSDVVELLRTAAIVGRSFDVALLVDAAGLEPEQVEDRLQVAAHARLLRYEGGERWTFEHDKVRECLYRQVTNARRRRLHATIGNALELALQQTEAHAAPPGRPDAQLLHELAFHWTRSEDRQRGADYAQRAAENAMRAYAAEEALGHFRDALELVAEGDRQRGELLSGLGDAALLVGDPAEAAVAFDAALTWYSSQGDTAAAARAARQLGNTRWRQEQHAAAIEAFEAALKLLKGEAGDDQVRVLVDLASLLGVSMHRYDQGIVHARRALELAQRLEEEQLVAAATRALGNLQSRGGDLDGGIALLETALELATAAGDAREAAECCAHLAHMYCIRGDLGLAEAVLQQQLEWARRCRDTYELRKVHTMLAVVCYFRARFAEGDSHFERAMAIVERLGNAEPQAYLLFTRAATAYYSGDYGLAETLMDQSIALFRAIGPGQLVWYLGWLALIRAFAGKAEAAAACLDELESMTAGLPASGYVTGQVAGQMAETALALGDTRRLGRYYAMLLPFAGRFHDRLVDRLLGAIELRQGELTAAAAHLRSAEELARREGIPHELALTLEVQAELALKQGGKQQARELLAEAADLFERSRAQPEARRINQRLSTLGKRAAARPRLPAGLSARELEVLRLVVAGHSNREIAAELVLSERTVENHLSSILGKTGAGNRAAAVAFAIRHGLA